MSGELSRPLIAFDRQHRLLLAAMAVVFVTLVSCRLHGWSLPMWHQVLDSSPAPELLRGRPRAIRSDDWLLDLPNVLAQSSHAPAFPVVNRNIGMGQLMFVPIMVPIRNVLGLLRPFTWGFWIGRDVGLSVLWWGLVFGLFYGFFLVFLLLSRNDFPLSFAGALVIVYSPYFQFWSFHKSPIAIFFAFAFVFSAYVLGSRRRAVVWAHGIALGWAAAAMALAHLYPPIFVPVAWLLPCAVAAWLLETRRGRPADPLAWHRAGAFALAGAIAAAALALFMTGSGDMIALIQNTTYPGKRFSPGGGYPLWPLFSHSLFAATGSRNPAWLGNICEGASFFFTFPLALLVVAAHAGARRRLPDWLPVLMAGALALILVYTYVGFPDALARATLFGMSTINRTQMALGIADALILVTVLARTRDLMTDVPLWLRLVCLAAWLAILGGFGGWMRQYWPELTAAHVAAAVAFNGAAGALWLIAGQPRWTLAAMAIASVCYTSWFNPVVQGGSRFFFENALSQKILEIDRQRRGATEWVAMGDLPTGNLFQIIGVKSLGGYHGYPHFALWKIFDPDGAGRAVYNQCAFVTFMPSASMTPVFVPRLPGVFEVQLNPASPIFKQAGVEFFVAAGPAIPVFEDNGAFEKIMVYADRAIFRRR